MPTPKLHTGYYWLNPDTSLNTPLNRRLGYSATLLPNDAPGFTSPGTALYIGQRGQRRRRASPQR